MRLRGSTVSKDLDYYACAIELFLTEYPDGNPRKRTRHLSGHNYLQNRKDTSKKKEINATSNINEIVSSSDESDVSGLDYSSDDEQSSDNESQNEIGIFAVSDSSTDTD